MVAYGVPHFPHKTAPEEFKALYPPEKIQLPLNVPPALQARARQEAQGYYAHCTALDKCIGDLLGTLGGNGAGDQHDRGVQFRPRRGARFAGRRADAEAGGLE